MASAKLGGKKQDEKHLKLLREMAALASNRHCFECGQRGPTYVNMTIGTFVCTACSGVLRGLNPPHRVKSISMASFTPEEIDFLKEHGNEYNKHVWLGLHDNKSPPTFEPTEEHKLRDYLAQKYERKRWYMEPTAELKEQAKVWNTVSAGGATADGAAKPRTGSSLGPIAGTVVSAAVTSSQRPQVQHTIQPPVASGVTGSTQTPGFGSTATTMPQSSGDLLSDLFSAPSITAHSATSGFGTSAAFPAMQTIASQPNQPSPFTGNFVTPAKAPVLLAGNSPQHAAAIHVGGSSSGPAVSSGVSTTASHTADKYAALADLFDTSSSTQHVTPQHAEIAVNWNHVNWGATQSMATSSSGISSQQKQPASVSVGWGNVAPSAAPAMSWPGSTMTSTAAPSTSFAVQGPIAFSTGASAGVTTPTPWGATQPAVALGLAAPATGLPANPFLASTASTAPYAAYTPVGAPIPPGTGKMAGYAVQGPGPASFGQLQPGFPGAAAGLGVVQPQGAAAFAMQPGPFGQPTATALGGSSVQVAPSLAPPANSGWAAWGQAPQPQARTVGAVPASAHTANPFAASVGSLAPNSVTNPFL